jgi:hypothetical protein
MVGIGGGLVAAFRAVYELREGRKQRQKDLRWKQANTAYSLIKEMLSESDAVNTITMMDWTGREYEITPKVSEVINFEDVRAALRIDNLRFTDKEVYIRDCFDTFLFHIVLFEQAINNGLIGFQDVIFPMKYYLRSIKKLKLEDILNTYMEEYLYHDAMAFFKRFENLK